MVATHKTHRIAAAAILAAVAHDAAIGGLAPGAGVTRTTPVRVHLIDDARYRAIFCGRDGTETSAIYAQTLARDLNELEATGRTTSESLAYIKVEACGGQSDAAPSR